MSLDSVERLLQKYQIESHVATQFGIVDSRSCLNALLYLHAFGYANSRHVRYLAKDFIRLFGVDVDLLNEYIHYFISDCSEYFKSAYLLFPILLHRAPNSITTETEILKTIRWINRGILTSQSIASVVFSCCSGVIERAIQLNLLSTLICEVFVQSNEHFVHTHWCTSINAFGGKMKTNLLAEFERLSLLALPVNELNKQFCVDHLKVYVNENLGFISYNDKENILFEDDEAENINSLVNDELVINYFSRLVECVDNALMNPQSLSLHVITMSDAIRAFAVDSSDSADELCTAPMPRRSIRQFYGLVEKFTIEAAKTDDRVQLRRLISLLLITHSKKVIDQCASQLNRTRFDLNSDEMESLCSFFWSCFLPNPREFRAYAISTALDILCKRFNLPVNDVMAKFCLLVAKTPTLAPYCDSVLSDVFIGSMSFVDFRQAYNQLLQQKRFDFHQTWNVIFEGVFSSISQPLPISYFRYRDSQVLNNMISELTIANDTKMPLIQRVFRFHWSLLLLERIRAMGPPQFDKDPQTQGITTSLRRLVQNSMANCPVFLLKQRFRSVLSSLSV